MERTSNVVVVVVVINLETKRNKYYLDGYNEGEREDANDGDDAKNVTLDGLLLSTPN